MKYGIIYKITDKKTNKSYIGQTTKDLDSRIKSHLREDKHISHALKKYGLNNFVIEEIVSVFNLDFLNKLETHFIEYYNTLHPNGFNHTCGGDNKGKVSERTRKKMSNSHKGHIHNRGRKHSFEYAYNIAKRKGLNPLLAINLDSPKQRIIFSYVNEADSYGFNYESVRQCLEGKRKHVKRWYFQYYNHANQSGSEESNFSLHAPRLGLETENINISEYNSPTRFEIPATFRGKIKTSDLYEEYLKVKSCKKVADKFGMKRLTVHQRLKRNKYI